MTVTFQEETVKNDRDEMFYIYIEQDKYKSSFRVGIAVQYDECRVGYPLNEHRYWTMQQAKRRFRDLRRQVMKGEY